MSPTFRIIIQMQDGSTKKLYTQTLEGYEEWAEKLIASGKKVADIFLAEITEEEAKRRGLK